ncbi:hypothetical protein R50076_30400 [Gilvimarinus japonicus]
MSIVYNLNQGSPHNARVLTSVYSGTPLKVEQNVATGLTLQPLRVTLWPLNLAVALKQRGYCNAAKLGPLLDFWVSVYYN